MWRQAAAVMLIAFATAQDAAAGTGRIAFASTRDGNSEIYVLDATTGRATRLTHTAGYERDPSWSPSGARLAFERDGSIWMLRVSTGAQTKFVNGCYYSAPDWAPDGSMISFGAALPFGWNILVKGLPTGPERSLNLEGLNASWSPDGAALVFTRIPASLWVARIADGSTVRLTPDDGYDEPAWSPDGSKIAFTLRKNVPGIGRDIYVMNAEGSGITQLTIDPADDGEPAWSPDGSQIAFTSLRSGRAQIFVMNADGSSQHRVTRSSGWDSSPDWATSVVGAAEPVHAVSGYPACLSPVRRSITLSIGPRHVATGRVTGRHECAYRVPLRFQRRSQDRWLTILRLRTTQTGHFAVRVADRPGRYRAVAPEVRVPGASPAERLRCLRAVSPPRRIAGR